MRAALLTEFGKPLSMVDVDVEPPHAGEVSVRVAASGVCGSDLKAIDGKSPAVPSLPVILGHESAGVVEAVGPGVTSVAPGDRVVVAMSAACGDCPGCRAARPDRCTGATRAGFLGLMPDGTTRLSVDGTPVRPFIGIGSFAEQVVVHERMLVRLPDDVPLDLACLLACGVVTGVGAVLNAAKVPPGARVLVVGCGGVGLNVVQGAVLAGAADVIAADVSPAKLELARRFGATDVVDAAGELPQGVDYAFDATGVPGVLARAMAATRTGGTTVMVGSPPTGTPLEVDPQLLFFSRTLRGCSGGDAVPARDLPMLAELFRAGRLDLAGLVSERLPLERVNEAFAALREGRVARTVITFGVA